MQDFRTEDGTLAVDTGTCVFKCVCKCVCVRVCAEDGTLAVST
jgi:hypothetical protein